MSDILNAASVKATASGAVLMPMSREDRGKFCIADVIRRWCLQTLGSGLKAVILTGSLARNEATWRESRGVVHFLSDAEFVVIVHDRAELPSKQATLLICAGAEEELRNQGVECKLSMGAVREGYLAGLAGTIFGYELLTCGEVLYGDPEIVRARAKHASTDISLEDGWRLLANRTVELLEIVPELAAGKSVLSEEAQYRLTKLYLDMASSLLVFKREFVAGYRARLEKLQELQVRSALGHAPIDLNRFIDRLALCVEYKIRGAWSGGSPFAMRDCVEEAVFNLRSLWAWELAQMNSAEIESPDALMIQQMRNQPLKARLLGWLFAVRREGIRPSLYHLLHWIRLCHRGSPRYCVYSAALAVWSQISLDSFGCSGADNMAIRNSLPIPEPVLESKVGAESAILWNYAEFLVETRT